jgi:hypothetical protein
MASAIQSSAVVVADVARLCKSIWQADVAMRVTRGSPGRRGSGQISACSDVVPWLMYLVSRYEDSELEGDDGEDDEDDEEDEEEEEEEEEKEEEGRLPSIASIITPPYHECWIIITLLFDCNSD